MTPTAAADAPAAMEAMEQAADAGTPFQVVVSDGQMPGVDGFALARWIRQNRRLPKTPVIMLTSMGAAEPGRNRRAGIAASLTKPVKHSDLFDALATLLLGSRTDKRAGKVPSRPAGGARARVTGVGHAEATAHGRASRSLNILVAEDNAANRKLVTALLERRGHRVKTVTNGRLALEAITGRATPGFDLVLMDLEMPELGGLDATRAIRAREGPGTRLPVLALTAHAMPGDRQRCLEAGMDGYLSKPIDPDELFAAVESRGRTELSEGRQESAAVTFDEAGALLRAGGDRALLEEIATLFRADSSRAIRQLQRALSAGDAEVLRLAAHSLKGSAANIGGSKARALAAELEQIGRSGSLEAAPSVLEDLRDETDRLLAALDAAGLLARARRRPPRREPLRRPVARGRKRR